MKDLRPLMFDLRNDLRSKVQGLKSGFTLIEILVVATIIGLLAAGAAASYGALTKSSRDAKRKADLEQIRSAIEQYRSNNNSYPASSGSGAGTFTITGIACSTVSLTDSSGNTYMSTSPTDPKCNTSSQSYYYTSSASDYTVGAYLEGATSGSTCGQCIGATACNYCLGPYGQK